MTFETGAGGGYCNWTLQQDGALSHTAVNTFAFLPKEKVNSTEQQMWPPNSPDLNAIDYVPSGVHFSRKFICYASVRTLTS